MEFDMDTLMAPVRATVNQINKENKHRRRVKLVKAAVFAAGSFALLKYMESRSDETTTAE